MCICLTFCHDHTARIAASEILVDPEAMSVSETRDDQLCASIEKMDSALLVPWFQIYIFHPP